MRICGVFVTAVVLLLLAPAASAREASTFKVSATGQKGATSVRVSGRLTLTVLNGATIRASLGSGKTVTAKSYSWSWRQSSGAHMGPVTQTMTLKVQIQSATGVADCVAGTNGVVKLVDSQVKKNGKTKDSITLGHWTAACSELTLRLANAGGAKANVKIKKSM